MKMHTFRITLLIIVVSLAVIIAGCASPATTTTTATTTATTPKTLKIGISAPMTGATASWGQEFKRAHELAIEAINADGGIKVGTDRYLLELISYDHKGQATEGVANVNKLIFQDGVKYISLHSSSPTLACLPITTENKILTIASGFARLIGSELPYSFRGEYTGKESSEGIYGYITSNMKDIKTVAGIGNDDDTGKSSIKGALDNAVAFGLKIVDTQYVPRGTTDFYPVLAKLLANNPDMIDVDSMAPADIAICIKQAREKGYKGAFVSNSQNDPALIISVAGEASAEGYIQEGVDFTSDVATPEMKQMYEKYLAKYGAPFNPNSGKYYNWPIAYKTGIETAQSIDTTKVAEVLPDTTLDVLGVKMTWGGAQRYGIKHQVEIPIYISQIKGGKLVTLGRFIPKVP